MSNPTLSATQTVSHLQCILQFHPGTSHNVNYEFNFLSISTQFTFNVGWVDFLYSIPTKNARRAESKVQSMYEENNSQDKPVVIGIDHGFSLMKTKHHIFSNGVVRCNGRPPVAENSFYYDGSYYSIGGKRKTVHEDKTADEDFFLLTLVAIATHLACGVGCGSSI